MTAGPSRSIRHEQAEYWGSKAAGLDGSQNYAGIADPAIDHLIRKVIFAKDREEQVAAVKALDRVLLANHFVIPSYTIRNSRLAYWDRIARPDPLPPIQPDFRKIWWSKSAADNEWLARAGVLISKWKARITGFLPGRGLDRMADMTRTG